MTKVAAYYRVSTDPQDEASQRAAVERFCAKQAWTIASSYVDKVSGSKVSRVGRGLSVLDDRPALTRLLDEAKRLGVKFIVVFNSARLARSVLASALIEHAVREIGLDIRSATEPGYSLLDGSDGAELIRIVSAAIAAIDRRKISRRMAAGRVEHVRVGKTPPPGIPPYGYRKVDRRWVIDEREAGIVRRVFALRKRGVTFHEVAQRLKRDNVATRKGGRWQGSHVIQILRRGDLYRGKPFEYGGVRTEVNPHPPILKGAKG